MDYHPRMNHVETLRKIESRLVRVRAELPPLEPKYRTNLDICLLCASAVTGVLVPEIRGGSRSAEVVFARNIACHLLRKNLAVSLVKIGRLLRRHHTSILNSLRRVEGNPVYEKYIDAAQTLYDERKHKPQD